MKANLQIERWTEKRRTKDPCDDNNWREHSINDNDSLAKWNDNKQTATDWRTLIAVIQNINSVYSSLAFDE